MVDELRRAVAFDAYAWLLTDPQSAVGCSPLADVPCLQELPLLIRLKYVTAINRWTALGDAAVALLSQATAGDRSRSLLWRDLLSRYDVGDVASIVFRDRYGTWGFLDLWRSGVDATFDDSDVELLSAVAPLMTTAIRRSQASTFLSPVSKTVGRLGPVVLLLSPDLKVLAQTPETEQHLRLLVPPAEQAAPIPASAYNVGAQLLAAEAGVDHHPPSARMHLDGGAWVSARAARIGGVGPPEDRDIAITIEACSPKERMAVFAAAFALSPREEEILALLATGADTRHIAREASMSEHTVQDHLKSIFAKTDSHNRRTVLSRSLGT
ncbi:MAG: hypothetical protein QOJ74_477 [Ilumatobacteraceae bacterium]|nr:hypothetical protein [Ilumatobacteraceae bacterium]